MARLYEDGGEQLATIFARAKELGLATSLDFALPDVASPAAAIDWDRWLATVLPQVDFFLPSLDEMLLLTRRDRYLELVRESPTPLATRVDLGEVSALAEQWLARGATVVGLKLGERGFFLRTARDAGRRPMPGLTLGGAFAGRELLQPCFEARAVAEHHRRRRRDHRWLPRRAAVRRGTRGSAATRRRGRGRERGGSRCVERRVDPRRDPGASRLGMACAPRAIRRRLAIRRDRSALARPARSGVSAAGARPETS
jgi:hypothetical protein